jgi:hypothetical protein
MPTTCVLALALPHVEEIDCDGFDFGVGRKGSSGPIPSASLPAPSAADRHRGALRRGRGREAALLLGEPAVFFTTPGYDGWPLMMLRLAEWTPGGWPSW